MTTTMRDYAKGMIAGAGLTSILLISATSEFKRQKDVRDDQLRKMAAELNQASAINASLTRFNSELVQLIAQQCDADEPRATLTLAGK